MGRFRALAAVSMLLAFVVVTLGAYVRLRDAGLACPDWPGCYGKLVGLPTAAEAAEAVPGVPLDAGRAWIEMSHRYAAALLGLLSLALAYLAFRWREGIPRSRRIAAWALAVLVMFQGLLGMLTVTELLMPAVVTAHLLGGMSVLALLAFLVTRDRGEFRSPPSRALRALAALSFAAALAQVALGGWVSTNHAGLSCPDFPSCNGSLVPDPVDGSGFALSRELGRDASGGPVTHSALATIHWAHRVGALALLALLAGYAAALMRESSRRGSALGLLAIAGAQASIGVGAVVYKLPLALAWLHNAFAALLVVNVSVLGARVFSRGGDA